MARFEERDEKDLLSQYLQEIAQYPLLTPERERELGRRVQENDKAALERHNPGTGPVQESHGALVLFRIGPEQLADQRAGRFP